MFCNDSVLQNKVSIGPLHLIRFRTHDGWHWSLIIHLWRSR